MCIAGVATGYCSLLHVLGPMECHANYSMQKQQNHIVCILLKKTEKFLVTYDKSKDIRIQKNFHAQSKDNVILKMN
jgi:hypothetical protein